MRNKEHFFVKANDDGTVTLRLADNRVAVSVIEWKIDRRGFGKNCRQYGQQM